VRIILKWIHNNSIVIAFVCVPWPVIANDFLEFREIQEEYLGRQCNNRGIIEFRCEIYRLVRPLGLQVAEAPVISR
jgi:hypothetical protein